MGQYYRAIVLPPIPVKKGKIIAAYSPLVFDNCSKLMAHSWIGNDFVGTIESFFMPGECFHKHRLVWAGDYADPEKGAKTNLYKQVEKKLNTTGFFTVPTLYRYLVNHSKKVYIDKKNQKPIDDEGILHPLPLLTCEGNGRGGGDYFSKDASTVKHIGSWARDIISVEAEVPANYTQLNVSF